MLWHSVLTKKIQSIYITHSVKPEDSKHSRTAQTDHQEQHSETNKQTNKTEKV